MVSALEGLLNPATSPKTKENAPRHVPAEKPGKPAGQIGNMSTSSLNWKRWIPIAVLVAILGISVPLGIGLLNMGARGLGPLAGLATATPRPTFTSTSTRTLIPTPTFTSTKTLIPTGTIPPTLAPGATQVSTKDNMIMVYVPAGNFLMGSTDSDSMANANEKPQHTVFLDAYWIDQTEVTNGMYAKCVSAGACQLPSYTAVSALYTNVQYANHPAVYVDWNVAQAYCAWAEARLPTEAEWEKGARGTDGRSYPWGNDSPTCSLASFGGCVGDTTDVGSYPAGASPYGALDMAGNEWEWVADWYDANYYANSPTTDPTGPASGQYRVLRGGSWDYNADFVRSAYRYRSNPTYSLNNNYFGFRCVLSP